MYNLLASIIILLISPSALSDVEYSPTGLQYLAHVWKNIKIESHRSVNYLRFQYAQSSDSDFSNAMGFEFDKSTESGSIDVLSIGRKIAESVSDHPVELVAYGSAQHTHENGYQSDAYGVSAYLKALHQFRVPGTELQARIGLAEGLSYISRIPSAEKRDFAKKDAESVKLMNYMEYSFDFPVSQFFNPKRIDSSIGEIYIGYTIWHRSTVFGLFGETGGGTNYQGIGIEILYR